MPEKPVSHGRDHRPGGFDPTETGPWHEVVAPGTYSTWVGGHVYDAGDLVEDGSGLFVYLCMTQNSDVEPGVTSGWPQYWTPDTSILQNGDTSSPETGFAPVRWRLVNGPPHILDDTGAVSTYSKHKLEIQGQPESGLSPNQTMFTLPPAYAPSETYIISYCDDNVGAFPMKIQANGDVIPGVDFGSVSTVSSSDSSVSVSNPAGPDVVLSISVVDGGSA